MKKPQAIITGLLVALFLIFALSLKSMKSTKNEFYEHCNENNYVCGQIDDHFADKVRQFIKDGRDGPLYIASSGGYQLVAHEIVSLINETNTHVIIDGICLSACALNFVLGVDRIKVSERSVIAFHHSGSFVHEIAKSFFPDNLEFVEENRIIAAAEKQFSSVNNVELNALFVPAEQISITCLRKSLKHSQVGIALEGESSYAWYVPSGTVVNKWRNKSFVQGLPNSEEEVISRLKKYFPSFGKNSPVKFGHISEIIDMELYLQGIRYCEDDVE